MQDDPPAPLPVTQLPMNPVDPENIADLYRNRFAPSELPRKNAIWREICHGFLQGHVRTDATVLDIGCGHGEFINNIQAGGRIAMDANPDSAGFVDSAVEFHPMQSLDLGCVQTEAVDVVFTSNFLEHLPDRRALETLFGEVMRVLKPQGRWLILGPNLRYLPGEYWDFYDHHLGLTHLSLGEGLRLHGFTIDQCIDRFLPYTTQGSLPSHPLLVRMYLKFPLAWRILGKQFFIVARKQA